MIRNKKVILASQSPRRQQLLSQIGFSFEIRTKPVEEIYPDNLTGVQISEYLVRLKADAFNLIDSDEIILTADTIVWHQNKALGKPNDADEARKMLQSLSGKSHEVITSVGIKTNQNLHIFSDVTQVFFRDLSLQEINHYIKHYQPFDKAGAYGIQEWIGAIGIKKIIGSYNNVVGLPTEKLYHELKKLGIYEL